MFARIDNLDGPNDGTGYVSSQHDFATMDDLIAAKGDDFASQCVDCDNVGLLDWYYDGSTFHEKKPVE